ncbi:YidB family protein [Methylobacterium sp. J-077]|uniref:YidB family protein n=1 Tax=Methylobacterium sp. J-077 TaxID=2836656 RepID=UPI0028C4E618|nr:YidB family protein [Methylobacterium sp. J-077]
MTPPFYEITLRQLQQGICSAVLDSLSWQTDLSHGDLLFRLPQELPSVVNRYAPDGRLPVR